MTPSVDRAPNPGRQSFARAADSFARFWISILALAALVILAGIASFLFQNSLQALQKIGLFQMVGKADWFPTSANALFGFLPAEVGSIWVTTVALVLSMPLGVLAAIYLSEFANPRVKEVGKTIIEFMAAVPSVVFGLMGMTILVPLVARAFDLSSGLCGLTAGLCVGMVCLPTVISISEDAMHAVPDELRQGALALGNNRWQMVYKVILPAASSGIFAAIMLGLGRAIGETMVVLMVSGNAGIIPQSPLLAARTMTGTIAQETGEVVRGGLHFSVLFVMGLVLFVVTFAINLVADVVLEIQRKRWRR